jgi:MYXO-CTERM domain-containing protein
MRSIRWVGASLLAALSTGCGASDGSPFSIEKTGRTSEAIFAGTMDDDANANPYVVSLTIGGGTELKLCTAALLAPNLLLTARHCISTNLKGTFSCDAAGESGNGDQLGVDVAQSDIHVHVGANPIFTSKPAAIASQILHPGGDVLCNGDIALVVLDTPIPNVPTVKVRLAGGVSTNETVRAVGYGQNGDDRSIGTRLRKDGVHVLGIGKGMSASETPLGSHEFEVGLSICMGDSGGPAISEKTGAVVGVVSRGGNCTDDFGHIDTMTGGFQTLIASAFGAAGADFSAAAEDPSQIGASSEGESDRLSGDSHSGSGAKSGGSAGGHACSAGNVGSGGDAGFFLVALGLSGITARRRKR